MTFLTNLGTKFSVDGYNPLGIFNLILSSIAGFGLLGVLLVHDENTLIYTLLMLVPFIVILFRNRKLKSVPKMVIFSIIMLICGVISIFAILLWLWEKGMNNPMVAANLGQYGSSSSGGATSASSGFRYTLDQERAAENAGYRSAYDAEHAGNKWNSTLGKWD